MLTAERNRLRSGCRLEHVKFEMEGSVFAENTQMFILSFCLET